jgi:hypothetical protein
LSHAYLAPFALGAGVFFLFYYLPFIYAVEGAVGAAPIFFLAILFVFGLGTTFFLV